MKFAHVNDQLARLSFFRVQSSVSRCADDYEAVSRKLPAGACHVVRKSFNL